MKVVFALLPFIVCAQEPTSGWKPRYQSLGASCSKGLKGNDGDCGCENTQFRIANGTMYIMDSVNTHPCSRLFPVAASESGTKKRSAPGHFMPVLQGSQPGPLY